MKRLIFYIGIVAFVASLLYAARGDLTISSPGTKILWPNTSFGIQFDTNFSSIQMGTLDTGALPNFMTAVGNDAGFGGSADRQSAFGASAGASNTGINQAAFGDAAGFGNSGTYQIAIGTNAGHTNTQNEHTAVGREAGFQNTGQQSSHYGAWSGQYNRADNQSSVGWESGFFNTGAGLTSVGVSAGKHNDWTNNTAIGYNAFNAFTIDAVRVQSFDFGDVDVGNNQVTITLHGLGSIGDFINLKFTAAGSGVPGLVDAEIDIWEVISVNILEVTTDTITATGSDSGHTLSPQEIWTNSTALGFNAEPTASNQVVLGDTNVTEVKTTGGLSIGSPLTITNASGTDAVITMDGTSTNPADFTYESDNSKFLIGAFDFTVDTDTFVVDAVANRVGVGTAAPNAPLEVKGALPGSVGGFPSGHFHVTGDGTAEFSNSVITGHNAFNTNTQLQHSS